MMHDSDEEEEQTALVCDNGLFILLYRNILSLILKQNLNMKTFLLTWVAPGYARHAKSVLFSARLS